MLLVFGSIFMHLVDPFAELDAIFGNFTKEVQQYGNLDTKTRLMVSPSGFRMSLSALVTIFCSGRFPPHPYLHHTAVKIPVQSGIIS